MAAKQKTLVAESVDKLDELVNKFRDEKEVFASSHPDFNANGWHQTLYYR